MPRWRAGAAATNNPPPRSFFGKFLGTHADYYVFETTLQSPPAEPEGAALGAVHAAAGRLRPAGSPGNPTQHACVRPPRHPPIPAMLRPAGEGEVPPEWNSGANGYVYFAANALGGRLEELPHVTPGQVKAARRIKKLLTGRLTSQAC